MIAADRETHQRSKSCPRFLVKPVYVQRFRYIHQLYSGTHMELTIVNCCIIKMLYVHPI